MWIVADVSAGSSNQPMRLADVVLMKLEVIRRAMWWSAGPLALPLTPAATPSPRPDGWRWPGRWSADWCLAKSDPRPRWRTALCHRLRRWQAAVDPERQAEGGRVLQRHSMWRAGPNRPCRRVSYRRLDGYVQALAKARSTVPGADQGNSDGIDPLGRRQRPGHDRRRRQPYTAGVENGAFVMRRFQLGRPARLNSWRCAILARLGGHGHGANGRLIVSGATRNTALGCGPP